MPNVMLVDDAIEACEPLAKFLERSGHRVTCVGSGKQALHDVIRELPDVLVLDLLMPGMDGASLLAIIRSYLRLQSLPVVVLTGLPDSPMVERVLDLGVESVLIKGKATLEDVRSAVNRANRRHVESIAPAPPLGG
jgi:two-component system alkaline phosphatase synthesis response regulator PhoP